MNFSHLIDPLFIIQTLGLLGVLLFVFAESGLFFGFFLPGDSLLFTAGFLASQGLLPAWPLFLGAFVAAVLGDNVGYSFGKHIGIGLFSKDKSFFFNKKYPEQARLFYEQHGKRAIIIARFIPIVRTFAPIVAGVGLMEYRPFFFYNILGAGLWTLLIAGGGMFLGRVLPNAEHYISLLVIVIVVLSVIPPIVHVIRERRQKKAE